MITNKEILKRNTKQKQIVLDTVRFLANHATAEEIYDEIHKDYPNISKNTVYRNLHSLAEDSQIIMEEWPGEPARFDHNVISHYHGKCVGCNKILDIDMDYDESLNERVKNKDLMVLSHKILFKCLCSDCLNSNLKKS